MRHGGWRALAAGAAAVAAVTVAGCSGGSGAPAAGHAPAQQGSGGAAPAAASPLQAVRLAAADASRARSAHVTGHMSVTPRPGGGGGAQLLGGPLSFRFVADEQWSPELRMRYTMTGLRVMGHATGPLRAVLTGDAMYLNVPMLDRQTGKPWLAVRLSDAARASGLDLDQMLEQARRMDPTQALRMLTTAGNLHRVGSGEQVGGVTTTHYAGDVDFAKAVRAASPDAAQLRRLAKLGLKTEHVDVWVDASGRLRRIVTAARGASLTVRADMLLSRYGERVEVSAPPASRTLDLHDLMGARDS